MSAYKQFITRHFESTNTFVTQFFKEINSLPEVGDLFEGKRVLAITPISMDCEQFSDDHHNYELYELECGEYENKYNENGEDETTTERVCVRKENEL